MTIQQGVIAKSDPAFETRPETPYVKQVRRIVESAAVRNNRSSGPRPVLGKVLIATDFSKHVMPI